MSDLVLRSDGLLSKWGFGDGDILFDYLEAHGVSTEHVDTKALLVKVVRRFLLPVLDQPVEVVEVGTAHNPVRASTVDGVDVEGEWDVYGSLVELTPERVVVPWSSVVEALEGM